ncbi:hypothetical protein P168DRAFT_317986 [Aspergillus campestris IBT 28561]|uniref:Uncharacterized protein n=1 Tax=Aspergillus campestris (strain IBT 28561) TaxID=1392248 RepID=A0A2I1D4Z7_ASPC2|nr:uncharacterized protein P168DRAFT_317986 [Aspergillus campestris IBT 28561]PKY04945.1 hypothetical protein P168DRAFT_317986 [Aspergillus campestris IBT 28561]
MLITIGISLIVAAAATCEITFVECISAQNYIDEKEKSTKIHGDYLSDNTGNATHSVDYNYEDLLRRAHIHIPPETTSAV